MKRNLLFIAAVAFTVLGANAQQVIGEYPFMEGGLESLSDTETLGGTGSGGNAPNFTNWTVSSSNMTTRAIRSTLVPVAARSGTKFGSFDRGTQSNARIQMVCAPATGPGSLEPSTAYTLQYFINTSDIAIVTTGVITGSIYIGGTGNGSNSPSLDLTYDTPANDTWFKVVAELTTRPDLGVPANANFASVRIGNNSIASDPTVNVDDFVVYKGSVDVTAPDAATAATTAPYAYAGGNATLNWTAPATGVDGGGYVVVSYASAPNADNDPNQNGIYSVGSTTTNGTGSLQGTVVYIGTATTATFTAPDNQFYKVYTVDKAFNYAAELNIAGNLSVARNEIAGFKMYPNPASSTVRFDSVNNDLMKTVTISSLTGQEIVRTQTTGSLNISGIAPGIYVATVQEAGKTSIGKLVIE